MRRGVQVAVELGIVSHAESDQTIDWRTQLQRLVDWTAKCDEQKCGRTVHRIKQWLNIAATFGNFTRFDAIKRARNVEELFGILGNSA